MIIYSTEVLWKSFGPFFLTENTSNAQRDRERLRYLGNKDLTDHDRDLYDEDSRIAE
jgi:hypothetical protein